MYLVMQHGTLECRVARDTLSSGRHLTIEQRQELNTNGPSHADPAPDQAPPLPMSVGKASNENGQDCGQ